MSACLALKQRNAASLLVDSAVYDRDGLLRSVSVTKVIAMPTLRAAFAGTGPVVNAELIATALTFRFATFDDLVANAEEVIPELFDEVAEERLNGDSSGTFYLVGWHERKDRPGCYAMNLWSEGSSRVALVLDESGIQGPFERGKLEDTPAGGTPLPAPELRAAAGWPRSKVIDDLDPAVDLLHLMEVQRQEEIRGRHWVGGRAVLTSVSREGITQRVVHTWNEDKVGHFIQPLPIDWPTWRRELGIGSGPAPSTVASLSRQQRRALERQQRQAGLSPIEHR